MTDPKWADRDPNARRAVAPIEVVSARQNDLPEVEQLRRHYADSKGRSGIPDVDDTRMMKNATTLLAREDGRAVGTMQVDCYRPDDEVPEILSATYAFPDFEIARRRLTVCVAGILVVLEEYRGGGDVFAALAIEAVRHAVAHDASLMFACAPLGLWRSYANRVGMHPITAAPLVQHPDGLLLPLVLVFDADDLSQRNSIVAQDVI
jgi:hypothetical protein